MSIVEPPYPADTRAKGWRFELDHERIHQSDTWALASQEVRPWLLMLWLTAWQQEPCGSLPNDDLLIAVRIGMPIKAFSKHRAALMRGWWLAADGRQYHQTITKRVLEMMTAREKERTRKAGQRKTPSKTADPLGSGLDSPPVPDLSHGTNAGQPGDYIGTDDTGTGTSTGTSNTGYQPPPVQPDRPSAGGGDSDEDGVGEEVGSNPRPPFTPTDAARMMMAMKAKGISDGNPSNPTFVELVKAGVSLEEFEDAAIKAVAKNAGFAYAIGTVVGERKRASELAKTMPQGPLAPGRASAANSNKYAAGAATIFDDEPQTHTQRGCIDA